MVYYHLMVDAIKLANLNDNLRRPLQKYCISCKRCIYKRHIALLPCQAFRSFQNWTLKLLLFHLPYHISSLSFKSDIFHVPIFIRQVYNRDTSQCLSTYYLMEIVQHSTILICMHAMYGQITFILYYYHFAKRLFSLCA